MIEDPAGTEIYTTVITAQQNALQYEQNQLSIRERSTSISLLFQNPDMQFCMATPREELLFCLENQCIPQADMPKKVAEAFTFCEISHLADQPFTTLPGGEQQLVALTCCLIFKSR